jgi:hypothetical protein
MKNRFLHLCAFFRSETLLPEFHFESHLSSSFFLSLISSAGIRFCLLPLDFSRSEFLLGLPARESRPRSIFLLDPSVGGV